jgi:hypothetical protein
MWHAFGQHVAAMQHWKHRPIDQKFPTENYDWSNLLECRSTNHKNSKAFVPCRGKLAEFISFEAGKHDFAVP